MGEPNMKQYILVQVHADKTARSTYFELEAPSYMYTKWENLMLEKPKILKVMLEKGPVLYTGIQTEDKFAVRTEFAETPIANPLMGLTDFINLEEWKKEVFDSGFYGKIFFLTDDETMLLLKLPGNLAKVNN
jgi:hypothetical protein